MTDYLHEIEKWPTLTNGIHYKWLVDYAAFSAFGTFELSNEEWENRDLIVNFKGNSDLTTEIDHQEALKKAISMVSELLQNIFGEDCRNLTLVCIPASLESHTKRRFQEFGEHVCAATGMENAYEAFSYIKHVNVDGDEMDDLVITEEFFKDKKIVIFDDIIASGGSVVKFADLLASFGADVICTIALGKKISDGYDQNKE